MKNLKANVKTKNGNIKNVILSAENIIVQDKIYRYTVVHDITELKMTESLLNQQLIFTTALNEIAEVVISSDNSEEIMKISNMIVGKTMQLDRILIYYVSFAKNCISSLCECIRLNHPDISTTKGVYTSLEMFLNPINIIMKTRKYLESHHNEVNEHFSKDKSGSILHNELKIKSLLWYPFAFDEGGFYLFTLNQILEERQWTKEELDFLESVARMINIALMKIKLLKEWKQTEEQLIETKERSLISQMNPHFIFNTLTAIQSYIYNNSPRQANQYISNFASLMRIYLTYSRKEFITVKEEIDALKYYLELQKLRFDNKFDYSMSFDNIDELVLMEIPPMLTQPLVENAIEHGIQNKKSKGHINVSFCLSDNYITFIVEDDGPGTEFTKKLNKYGKHISVSTSIIKERLEWLNKKYSKKITYEIKDITKNGEIIGTSAKISIPYQA